MSLVFRARRPQVLLVNSLEAMVVLHTGQRSIKISNYFRIVALLGECQITLNLVDRRVKLLYFVQVSPLPRGFENNVPIPNRQIDSFQNKHTNEAVDTVR